MTIKKETTISADDIVNALASNPKLLETALKKMGAAPQGTPAFEIINVTEKDIQTLTVKGTKIVPKQKKNVKHYLVRMMNGGEVSIPEHELSSYGIKPDQVKLVDEDGLSQAEKSYALENGAF